MKNIYLELLGYKDLPLFLKKYLNVPSLVRLKDIGYFCGMDYASKNIYDFNEYISRFDHSLSVSLLTWNLTKDKNATLAALFHDVSTPCFSHVIDYMNKDYEIQESTEEYTFDILNSDKKLLYCLKEDNLKVEDISDFKKYSIVDNDRPRLCTDRLDGIILTSLFWTKELNINEVSNILNDLEIYESEIGFKTKSIAEYVIKLNNKIDIYCHSKEDNYMMELLASITKSAINKNLINYEDLYKLTEKELFKILDSSNDEEILSKLKIFREIKIDDIPDIKLDGVKKREIKPLVRGKRIGEYND